MSKINRMTDHQNDELQIPEYTPPADVNRSHLALIFSGAVFLSLVFFLGWWWGNRLKPQITTEALDPGQVLAQRFSAPLEAVGKLEFIFFADLNQNGVFDQNETSFRNVSVDLRRQGQESPFQSVPADNDGKIVIAGLPEGNYEARYRYSDLTGYSLGDFNIHNWYQIVSPTGAFKRLPSDWESLPDTEQVKRGIIEYLPEKLIIGQTFNQLYLIDPATNQVYGLSTIYQDDSLHRFTLLGGQVYYVANNELKSFDVKTRLTQSVIKPVYGVDPWNYQLSPQADILVFIEDQELSYTTSDNWCGQGAIFDEDGYRLEVFDIRVAFKDSRQFNVVAHTTADLSDRTYLVSCQNNQLKAFLTNLPTDQIQVAQSPPGATFDTLNLEVVWGEINL